MKNKLGLLCIVILGASLAFAQAPVDNSGVVWHANGAQPVTSALVSPIKIDDVPVMTARLEGDPGFDMPFTPATADKSRAAGTDCPTGYICGQNYDSGENNAYYYSDLSPDFCSAATGNCANHCVRRTAEDFPPPGTAALTIPVGVIVWRGAYTGTGGNLKPNQFEIKFYPFDPADPNRPLYNSPTCSYPAVVPFQVTKIRTINWTGGGTSDEFQFTAVLPTPCTIAQGYFSIASSYTTAPGIAFLWAPSDSTQGNARTTRWWTSPDFCVNPLADSNADRQYCFGENKPGACCNDATALCDPNSNEFACLAVNGRFAANQGCGVMNPACGLALGACCKDDGTCTTVTYAACVGDGACCVGSTCTVYSQAACIARNGTYKGNGTTCSPNPCVTTYCRGDASCDSQISFADINPFVQALGNLAGWQAAHPGCAWQNCDVNADGVVSFADINPFVQKLGTPGPCPTLLLLGPDKIQGNQWLGSNTLCTSCCTILVDPNAPKENEPNDCTTDHFNGGCNSTPTVWVPMPLNQWFYGESGTFGAGFRDTDWYQITLTGAANHTLTIQFQAEFDVAVELAKPGDCDANLATGYATLSSLTATKCTDPNTAKFVSRCLPSGTYWVIVAPQAFDGVPCGADYKLIVSDATGCTFCSVPPPATGTVYTELETCGGDTNGGCNVTPAAFEFVGTDWNGTIRGSLYAKYPQRDLDWYSFKISAPSRIKWDVLSELPVRASIEFQQFTPAGGTQENIPPVCGGTNYYWTATLFTACTLGSSSTDLYYPDPNDPNLPYYLFIAPEDASGAIFDGYPCGTYGTNENDYNLTLTSTILSCPTICVDFGWLPGSDPAEGEPVCSNEYNDAYNFGCDRQTGKDPNRMLVLNDGVALCAQNGIFTKNAALRPDYDWYKFTITGSNAQLYIETAGEFAYNVELYYSATNSCNTLTFQEKHTTTPCDVMTITSFCYAPGTYWIRVYAIGTNVPCGKNYVLRVSAVNQPCTQCHVQVPPVSPAGCISEGETCSADTNGGCDSTNALYGTITCNQCIYGSNWASAGENDTDFYRLVLATPQYIQWNADAEFPAVVWLFESPLTCTALSGDAEMAGPCNQVTHKILDTNNAQILFPAGTYYIMVQPGTIANNLVTSITENYPCGSGRTDYWVQVQCSGNPFP